MISFHLKHVDSRKLEKAEQKLKQKAEKRELRSNPSSFNNILKYDSASNASASQSISRKAENQKDSDSNRSYDICIENFDVAFGNK